MGTGMEAYFFAVLTGYLFSVWVLVAQADGGTMAWVDKHGFTTVFAVLMLGLLIYTLKLAGSFVKGRFDDLEARCKALSTRLDTLTSTDRDRLETLVDNSAASQRDMAVAISGLVDAMRDRPCQWTLEQLRNWSPIRNQDEKHVP